jgi:hypothetical protein
MVIILRKCTERGPLMADTILLVFEGTKTEPGIFDNIQNVFFKNQNCKRMVYALFGTNILKLWKELNADPDFDTVVMLQNTSVNKDDLKSITRENVSEIHLFFDFEGHLPEKLLDDYSNILCDMLKFFSEETDHGKLWISYPMVEALKHTYKNLTKCFDCIQKIDENTKYKEKVGKINDFQDVRRYIFRPDWCHIIAANTRKAICLVNGAYSLPAYTTISSALEQSRIFEAQKEKYIMVDSTVVVLSSFPFFLLYYFKDLYNKIPFDEFDKGCKFKHIIKNETASEGILA